MESQNKLILHLNCEGGSAEIYKTYKGLYKIGENLYVTFQDAFEGLKSDLHFVTPQFVDKEIRNELSEIINSLIISGKEFNPYSIRAWEIWLNRKFSRQFFEIECQELTLKNVFGADHKELHFWLEKLLQEYLHFQNIIHHLKPDNDELEDLLKQHSFASNIFLEYGEALFGWCLNTDKELINPICGYSEEELSNLKKDKRVFTYKVIEGLSFNEKTNLREIAFNDYSILLKEIDFEKLKQKLINEHLEHSNRMLDLLSGEINGVFSSFKPKISGIISTDLTAYESVFGSNKIYLAYYLLLENPEQELYDYPSDRFENHRVWQVLYECFNKSISYGCLYDTLLKSGYDKKQSLLLSGLENETHLRLSEILREGYIEQFDLPF